MFKEAISEENTQQEYKENWNDKCALRCIWKAARQRGAMMINK